MFRRIQHVHFVGIGGIGMCGLAELLQNQGYRVTGSDLRVGPTIERLRSLGVPVSIGHDAANVGDANVVVFSSAVRPTNAELREAELHNIPVIGRAEMLAEVMRLKDGIAVAGSHGKTTTTSMVAAVLAAAGLDPTLVVGGRLNSMGSNARLGNGDFMVVESDESDRSFLHLAPILAVITSIDREHLDCYGSLEELRRAFAQFANQVPFYGASIVCLDEENIRAILPHTTRRVVTYGTVAREGAPPDLFAEEILCGHFHSQFRLKFRGADLGPFSLQMPGRHNVLNAMAAVAVGLELKMEPEKIRQGLAAFGGVERRFQVRGMVNGITVVDDYGHHPTEIRATLDAARDCDYRRVIVVFEPHRYSRTALLLDEFAGCFTHCESLFVLDIYPAGEPPIQGISAKALVDRIRQAGHSQAEYLPAGDDLLKRLAETVQPGDLLLTLGAGSVWKVGENFLEYLRKNADKSLGAPVVRGTVR